MRCLLFDSVTGKIAAETVASEALFTDEANGYADATVLARTEGLPESLLITRPWSHSLALVIDNTFVAWAGPIIRREGNPGTGAMTITARQWEGWLDRVYLTDEWDDDGEADAASVIAGRLDALSETVASYPWALTPPLPLTPEAPAGVVVPYSWRSSVGVDTFNGEPPSVLDDIRTVTERGIRFAYVPHLTPGAITFTLSVDTYALGPVWYLQVGLDVANLTLATDGAAQTTHWQVVGEDAALTAQAVAAPGYPTPLLMSTASYPSVATQAALAPLADALLAQTREPVVVARDVEVFGSLPVRAGDLVQIDVPAGAYPHLWPGGASWQMRATTVEWRQRPGEAATTRLSLAQPIDPESAWAIPQTSLSAYLANLDRRVRRISTRRTP